MNRQQAGAELTRLLRAWGDGDASALDRLSFFQTTLPLPWVALRPAIANCSMQSVFGRRNGLLRAATKWLLPIFNVDGRTGPGWRSAVCLAADGTAEQFVPGASAKTLHVKPRKLG